MNRQRGTEMDSNDGAFLQTGGSVAIFTRELGVMWHEIWWDRRIDIASSRVGGGEVACRH
jgi:hypothetical protein